MQRLERSSRRNAATPGNLDFDARVPIPFSVFPSSYRSDAVTTETDQVKVEGEVNLPSSRVGREGHEARYSYSETDRYREDDVRVEEDRTYRRRPGRREEKVREEVRIYERDQRDREERPAGRTTTRVEEVDRVR